MFEFELLECRKGMEVLLRAVREVRMLAIFAVECDDPDMYHEIRKKCDTVLATRTCVEV